MRICQVHPTRETTQRAPSRAKLTAFVKINSSNTVVSYFTLDRYKLHTAVEAAKSKALRHQAVAASSQGEGTEASGVTSSTEPTRRASASDGDTCHQ